MARHVRVVPHDPSWSAQFRAEAEGLTALFGVEIVAIHHIDSTAIPGVSAKPIIDVLVEVREIEGIDSYNEAMIAQGYTPRGENGILGRCYYVKYAGGMRTHHIHMFQVGSAEIEHHLAFRDYMIAHSDDAQAYGRLKEELAARFPYDAQAYSEAKRLFIEETDQRARIWWEGSV